MNKNPFVPTPTYTPPQPPLPPGPPPTQPGQPDYSAWWAASAAAQHAHTQAPVAPQYNPQWSATQPPRPPPEQSALYANYGYGTQQNHWQRQQQQQQLHQQQQQQQQHQPPPQSQYQPPPQYHVAPPQVAQPPQQQPGYNPYQPTAGYPQQYVPQAGPPPQPIVQPAYPHPPTQPQQPFFNPHLPPQNQPQQPRLHHTPPQHLPPAKRQRFDGPNSNRGPQHASLPPQPQFQPPPAPPAGGSFQGPNVGRGPPLGPGQMGTGRGGPPGGRGGSVGGQRGRGGSFSNTRGGPAGRGRGTGSGYMGGSGNANRGGPGGQAASGLRGHGSRAANFAQNRRAGGSSFTSGGFHQGGGSFRNRNQGQNRTGPRQDGPTAPNKDSSVATTIPSSGKKEENRRTLTDFKIVGLSIPELDWTWGSLSFTPSETIKEEVKDEPLDSAHNIPVKDEVVDDKSGLQVPAATDKDEPQVETKTEISSQITEVAEGAESQKIPKVQPPAHRYPVDVNGSGQPPSRMRIYFDTPVTADDSRPIPHHATPGYGDMPSDSRKGKRKKLEDDDGDLEEGRAPPPPPQMSGAMNDDRSSVAASVAPSVTETASEGDWLMAAIVEGEEEAQAAAELRPDGEADDSEGGGSDRGLHNQHGREDDLEEDLDADAEGEVEVLVDDGHEDDVYMTGEIDGPAPEPPVPVPEAVENVSSNLEASLAEGPASVASNSLESAPAVAAESENSPSLNEAQNVPGSEKVGGDISRPDTAAVLSDVISSSPDTSLFESTEESSANLPDSVHVQEPEQAPEIGEAKSLQAASADSTLLVIETQEATLYEEQTQPVVNGQDNPAGHEGSIQEDHLPEPPMSPESNVHEDGNPIVINDVGSASEHSPSRNRLSISYASGNRRLVVDADVVTSFKLFRQEGRIEVAIDVSKNSVNGVKGVLVEALSNAKSYVALPNILDSTPEVDETVPMFSKLPLPASVQLIAHLDVARPLSEPKWAKTGDVQDWLRSMLGSRTDEVGEGWEKKIEIVDPDPPPTIWTVLEGWATNSPVGLLHERQRFLKTHMTETDNVLEVLLRLVRGERATPFSQNTPTISGPSISGPLLSALSPGSAHGPQQTHVSLAVLALFRLTVEYAKKANGDKGKGEVEDRVGEIIRCLPSHLIYKSLDGIFKEWKLEKKGGR